MFLLGTAGRVFYNKINASSIGSERSSRIKVDQRQKCNTLSHRAM